MRKFWYILSIIAGALVFLYFVISFFFLDDDMMFIGICVLIYAAFTSAFLGAGIDGLRKLRREKNENRND